MATAVTTPTEAKAPSDRWLARPLVGRVTIAAILLAAIVLLSLGLHLYDIQSIGNGNAYYTAAVKSMLQSWHNFFFVAAEPGGSVTVDKPPLGLWIEAAFAAVLGVSGFSVTLPNILAGLISIPVLYHLVKKYFGVGAGLAAALVLAVTPVTLAVDRNNTIDALLILTLLLAAWAFLLATETGRLRFLLLGGLLVGLGFNIKMLQAFLPLPAFAALYFLGSKQPWLRKLVHLTLTSVVLAAVSFSWAAAVQLTPADQRPYIGSSQTNSVMELIFGYNGIDRLIGMFGNRPQDLADGSSGTFPQFPQGGQPPVAPGAQSFPPDLPRQDGGQYPYDFPGGPTGSRFRGGFLGETGDPGALRFFQIPLGKEMSWALPFALISLALAAVSTRVRLPLDSSAHKGLVLWGGWLVTCLVFFSIAGFFHNYYLATLSPALGASVGMGFACIAGIWPRRPGLAGLLLLIAGALTLAFQALLLAQLSEPLTTVWAGAGLLGLALLAFLAGRAAGWSQSIPLARAAALLAILVVPAVWSGKTVAAGANNSVLPAAYSGDLSGLGVPANLRGGARFEPANQVETQLLAYLQGRASDTYYLVAVPSAQMGAGLVLATGRPVLYMGGFTGTDPVVSAAGLARMVKDGELRYVLSGPGPMRENSEVSSWVSQNCKVVEDLRQASTQVPGQGRGFGEEMYRCGD